MNRETSDDAIITILLFIRECILFYYGVVENKIYFKINIRNDFHIYVPITDDLFQFDESRNEYEFFF